MRLIDADELIEKYGGWYTEEGTEDGFIGTIEALVNAMPSVQPERKTGKWIYTGEDDGNGNAYCNCSICGAGENHSRQVKVRYCWNCGAEMREDT